MKKTIEEKSGERGIKKLQSKILSYLNKKQITFCKKIGLSVRPSARQGALVTYLLKNKIKIGGKIDFRKIEGMKNALGRKERAFLNSFYKVDVKPLTYSVKYDNNGKKTGFNTKKIETGTIVKL